MKNGTIIGVALLTLALLGMLFYCNGADAQVTQFSSFYRQNYTTTGSDVGISTIGSGTGFFKITWSAINAPATCTFAVDTSPDNSTWTAGGLLTNTTCTTSNTSAVLSVVSNYFRISRSALSGTNAAVTIVVAGYSTNPTTTAATQKFFTTSAGVGTNVAFSTTTNVAFCKGVVFTNQFSASNILYNVTVADNTANLYDIGFANSSGVILAHTGPIAGTTFAAATGARSQAITGAPATVPAGAGYICLTTNAAATPASIGGTAGVGMNFSGTVAITAGGTLTNFTPPSDNYTQSAMPSVTAF